ncbi:MAG: SDR family oxidoreductase, partial [Pseudomonadota bacterium]
MTTIVIGAGGFVGGALVRRLQAEGQSVVPVGRGQAMPSLSGDVFYCAGLTADFRSRPHDTISAHVSLINDLLRDHTFDSLTYLSSTRVYQKAVTGRETESIPVDPADPSDLYNLSKLTGEAICLNDPRPTVRTVRLSNVFGPGSGENFLDTVIAAVRRDGRVHIGSGATGAKDYIAIDDVIDALLRVPDRASSRLLNLASGT